MLFKNTVEPTTWRILVDLMKDDFLQPFFLVGGTALSLKYGHRTSIDIDLFTTIEFDVLELKNHLEKNYSNFDFKGSNNKMLFCFIDDVKVDFVKYTIIHPLKEIEIIESVRFASTEDIAALKLNAISQRGSKKDFYDLYLLLQHYTVEQLIEFYKSVFTKDNAFELYRSMNYFDDAEDTIQPIYFGYEKWETIKSVINHKIIEYFNRLKK